MGLGIGLGMYPTEYSDRTEAISLNCNRHRMITTKVKLQFLKANFLPLHEMEKLTNGKRTVGRRLTRFTKVRGNIIRWKLSMTSSACQEEFAKVA